jgi:drug/metabolite transporter (DMT)-like permease
LCIFSAVGYTATNICLRMLADTALLAWSICVKELVTVAVVGPWILVRIWRGLPSFPPPRSLLVLIAAGLAVQVVGNLGMIWSFGVVGLSVALPVALGVSLAVSALLGWMLLGERVSRRSVLALAILIASIVVLKLGADQGPRMLEAERLKAVLGVGAAILAGFSYASLTVAIRSTAAVAAPLQGIVFVVTGMGVVSLGPLSLWRHGPAGLLATPPGQLNIMILAGVLNLVAFLAITKGLHLTTIVHANVLGASQVAMAAVAGIWLFKEPLNQLIVLGILLAILAVTMIERPARVEEAATGV